MRSIFLLSSGSMILLTKEISASIPSAVLSKNLLLEGNQLNEEASDILDKTLECNKAFTRPSHLEGQAV